MFGQSTMHTRTWYIVNVQFTLYFVHICMMQRESEKESSAIRSDTIWQIVRHKFHFKARPGQASPNQSITKKEGNEQKHRQFRYKPVHLLSIFWLHTNALSKILLHFRKVKANFAELYNTFMSCQLIKFRKWLGLFSLSLPPFSFLSVPPLYSIIIYFVKCVSASFHLHGCGIVCACAIAISAHIFSHITFEIQSSLFLQFPDRTNS